MTLIKMHVNRRNMKVILGSTSKRRQELMNLLKIPYEVMGSNEDEVYDKSKNLYEQCLDIAYHKALNVYKRTEGERIVIGSDTVVILDNKILGKPKDKEDAFRMVKELSGKKHEVVTSISVLVYKDGVYKEEKLYDIATVFVSAMSDEEINDWVNNHSVLDKAGAYAIQDEFGKFIERIEGDYYTIVGFPISKVYQILKKYLTN